MTTDVWLARPGRHARANRLIFTLFRSQKQIRPSGLTRLPAPMVSAQCEVMRASASQEPVDRDYVFLSPGRDVKMDNFSNRDQPDRSKINMGEDFEVKCWLKALGISRSELQRAVDKVGNSAAAVRKEWGV
jgi:hypothetical protein